MDNTNMDNANTQPFVHYSNASAEQREFIEKKIREGLGGVQSSLVEECITLSVSEGALGGEFDYDRIQNFYADITKGDVRFEVEGPDEDGDFEVTIDYDGANESLYVPPKNPERPLDGPDESLLEKAKEDLLIEIQEQYAGLPQDIMEWWFVTDDWLKRKLIQQGEPVLDNAYGTWWGRAATGQRISLDETFWAIYQQGVLNVEKRS